MKVALFTTTLYQEPGGVRFNRACSMMAAAKEAGIPVFVADSSPKEEVRTVLAGYGATVLKLEPGDVTAQRLLALGAALDAGAELLFFIEPEKDDLIKYAEWILDPLSAGKADLVIPARSPWSWDTYPRNMHVTERQCGDTIIREYLKGEWFDLLFGPWAARREVISYFLRCDAPFYSWAHEARLRIIRDLPGRVVSVPIDFEYPAEQYQEEHGNRAMMDKRVNQLQYLFNSLIAVFGAEAK